MHESARCERSDDARLVCLGDGQRFDSCFEQIMKRPSVGDNKRMLATLQQNCVALQTCTTHPLQVYAVRRILSLSFICKLHPYRITTTTHAANRSRAFSTRVAEFNEMCGWISEQWFPLFAFFFDLIFCGFLFCLLKSLCPCSALIRLNLVSYDNYHHNQRTHTHFGCRCFPVTGPHL